VAINRDTGHVEWTSAANEPGNYFFGYSYFTRDDGSKLLFMACRNGLHALSSETGEDLWWIERRSTGGITPCVDQEHGWVFYQRNGEVLKLRAIDGTILKSAAVSTPNTCISWNTVLVNDSHGYFVATRWYGAPEWDSALRVYDADLNLLWQKTRLPHGKKTTMTYADGKLIVGCGNGWSKKYTGDRWKYVAAHAIADGRVVWKCDLKDYAFGSIMNIPYCGGCLFAETQDGEEGTSKLFRIDAATGKLQEVLDYGRPLTSCATCIVAHGMILSGDLHSDGIVVTQIAANTNADWPGPFGDPQTNQMAVPFDANVTLTPMSERKVSASQ